MATRLKVSGTTPKQEAIAIAMTLISNGMVDIDGKVNDADQPLTSLQRRGIYNELVRIHNRLGERFDGDYAPIDLSS
jgi:hypothetical protein